MPVQSTPTKLTIAKWAQIMGVNDLHFFGVTLPNEMLRVTCDIPWMSKSWYDSDRVGRDEVAQAIAEAEADLEAILGYRLLPAWEADEWKPTTRPYRPETFNLNTRDVRGMGQTVGLDWGYLVSGGIRSVVPLVIGAPIVYSSTQPPSTYDNLATVVVGLLTLPPPCEIAVYYPGHAGDEQWRIRPVNVTAIGSAYTITFAREQALIPDFLDTYDLSELRGADGTVDANFLEEVDVGRVFNDPQQQASMIWEPSGASCASCGGSGCPTCGYASQTACLMLRGDPRLSAAVPSPANWNATTLSFDPVYPPLGRQPDLIRFWYYAGWRAKSGTCPLIEMDDDWARVVAYFAASKLSRPPCACSKNLWSYWAADLAFVSGAEELASYAISASDLGNPLGTRRGAINAWRRTLRPGATLSRSMYG